MEHERTISSPSLDPSRASPCASAAGSPRAPHLLPAETPPAWMIEDEEARLRFVAGNPRPQLVAYGGDIDAWQRTADAIGADLVTASPITLVTDTAESQRATLDASTRDLAHIASMLAPPTERHTITLGDFSIPVVTSLALREGEFALTYSLGGER